MTKHSEDDEQGWTGKSIHPMQPVVIDERGSVRFQRNPLVRKLMEEGEARGYGLNELVVHADGIENGRDHLQHFSQLIGYSVPGYATLSYHNRNIAHKAERLGMKLEEAHLAQRAQKENKRVQENLPPWED